MNDVPAEPAAPVKKPPRKPRPSEIAAKKAKAKRKPAPKKAKRGNGKVKARTERLDMRITKAEKQKLAAKAKAKGIPITYVVLQAIAKLR